MKVVQWNQLSDETKIQLLKRSGVGCVKEIFNRVKLIIDAVKTRGDQALLDYTKQFDGINLSSLSVNIKQTKSTDTCNIEAIKAAIHTIREYHLALKPKEVNVSTAPGVDLSKIYKPIQRVGLYVPGGNTPLLSSLLMLAIPSQIAGNPIRVMCTPPMSNGDIHPNLKTSAVLCGIEKIYVVGGAQAIAAMAYGTETIPKVDKIFGPGNRYVTAAKELVAMDYDGATIDMPAGPSEVMVLADQYANPDFVAADLLSQAEHGPDSQAILVTTSNRLIEDVLKAIDSQKKKLSRIDLIDQSLCMSRMILVESDVMMVDIANQYAAEHLIINTNNAEALIDMIHSAGTIFVGPWASESLGDYVTGSNHVLPTYGYARSISGLTTSDFMKSMSIQRINKEAILDIGKHAQELASAEGLTAHKNAISVREAYLCQSNN